ncbi:ATP-binding protein [Pyrobaculum aerophilum]|uniref:ATPase n=1 Tax=Pyrobaculum aerophilum TaxID=13773 RepID=A0A371QUV9_9CREN|nr:ATP-binding protein [Pyrobaculum aerophilum]RFA93540.1 ATPase [Pyrobaculum aerophilum]RFA99000.1 ATPase [Pyrobaculum aerophilum]
MIKRICLDHFRGVINKCIELGRFTLVHGPPNSGKTTFFEALALLIQSRGEQWLALEGPLLIIHEPEDLHSGGDLTTPFVVEFTAEFEGGGITYGYKYATATNYVEQWVGRGGRLLAKMAKRGERGILTYPKEAELCVAPYAVMNEDVLITCEPLDDERIREAERALLELRVGLKDKFYLISGRRLAAWKYTYETHVDLMPLTSVGAEGQFTPHHLSRILTMPSYEAVRDALYNYLEIADIEDVRVGLVKTGRIALYVKKGGLWTNGYNAGNYTKAVLPVLLQMLLANEGASVFIDDVDLAVPSGRAEALLSALFEIARRRNLQLVASAKEPGFAEIAEKLGFTIAKL